MSIITRFGWLKTVIIGLAAVLAAGTTIVRTVQAIDARYAKQVAMDVAIKQQQGRVDFQVNDLKVETLKNRRSGFRDRKFDLEEQCRKACSPEVRRRIGELTDEINETTEIIRKLGGQ